MQVQCRTILTCCLEIQGISTRGSNYGFNISSNDIARPSWGSDCRTCSSSLKRKRGGKNLKTVDVIKDAMACQTNHLRLIAEWSRLELEDETSTRRDSVRALHVIPELSRFDRAYCSWILMNNLVDVKVFLKQLDNEKLDYCTVILWDAPWLFMYFHRLLLLLFYTSTGSLYLNYVCNNLALHVFSFSYYCLY